MQLNYQNYLMRFFLIVIFFIINSRLILCQMPPEDHNKNEFSQEYSPEVLQNTSDEIDRLLSAREEEFKKKNTEICLSKKDIILDSDLICELFLQCPERLRYIIEALIIRNQFDDDLYQEFIPQHIVLVGPPGVGKSSLARAIAQAAGIPYTFIKSMTLANEYVNSGPSNLLRIFDPILKMDEPYIVIIDELQTLIRKKDNNEFDMAAAEVLWMLLDECKAKNNILIIATANDISNLPEQLKSRFAKSVYEIKMPGLIAREKIISYYITKSKVSCYGVSSAIIKDLARKTVGFSSRNLEDCITIALSRAFFNAKKTNCLGISLTKDDLYIGFDHIKNQRNNSYFVPQWCKDFVKYVGPATLISLGLNVAQMVLHSFLQYYDRKAYLTLTQAHHNELVSISKMQNQALLQQNERFNCAKI